MSTFRYMYTIVQYEQLVHALIRKDFAQSIALRDDATIGLLTATDREFIAVQFKLRLMIITSTLH